MPPEWIILCYCSVNLHCCLLVQWTDCLIFHSCGRAENKQLSGTYYEMFIWTLPSSEGLISNSEIPFSLIFLVQYLHWQNHWKSTVFWSHFLCTTSCNSLVLSIFIKADPLLNACFLKAVHTGEFVNVLLKNNDSTRLSQTRVPSADTAPP